MNGRRHRWVGLLGIGCALVTMLLGAAAAGPVESPFLERETADPAWEPEVWNRLLETTLPLRDDGSRLLQRARLASEKAPESLNAILVMCDFADSLMLGRHGEVPGEFPDPAQSERYYHAHDALYYEHQLSLVADYFTTVSAGRFHFDFTVHPRTVNLPQPMAFYGNHPQEGEQKILLAATVIDSLDAEIDFEAYDTYLIVHAGAGEETDILGDSPDQIYSSFLSREDFLEAVEEGILERPFLPFSDDEADTMQGIDQVLVLPETEYQDPYGIWDGHFGSLGVYCFEVGLRLGMLSLSDFTPAGRPDSQGIGQYGLMSYGLFTGIGMIPPQPCAFNRHLMGWIDVVDLDPMSLQRYELHRGDGVHEPDTVYRVSLTGQEYWLVEYRAQDPDGNRAFSFADDKNGNHIYDYWDADTEDHRPVLGGNFDAATDSLERPVGAEWDFSMSENGARGFAELGVGSGAYIWHIDEGRIREVFDSPSNLFNADPAHKSVDLEEADGIQDLDAAIPTDYWLGGDDDSYRGEGAATFGPATDPATDTAWGSRTGITFADFSPVFQRLRGDTLSTYFEMDPPRIVSSIQYADSLAFTLYSEMSVDTGPDVAMRREFADGVDLRGSHVLLADLDVVDEGDGCGSIGQAEIVLAGGGGEIFVLDENLEEYPVPVGDPGRIWPLVTVSEGGQAVTWNQPAAVGDIDGDGAQEIVLTTTNALFAFNPDGSPVRPASPGADGLYAELAECGLPPVLIPADGDGTYCATEAVVAAVVERMDSQRYLSLYGGPNGELRNRFALGALPVPSQPVFTGREFLVVGEDTLGGGGYLWIRSDRDYLPEEPQPLPGVDLEIRPGRFPITMTPLDPDLGEDSRLAVHVPGRNGAVETLVFEAGFTAVEDRFTWLDETAPASPLAPGQAFVGDGVLGRAGHYGHWLDGWPRRPQATFGAAADGCAASPLVARITNSGLALWQYLFPVPDGRIFGLGTEGEWIPFWPLGGPAETAGTPAIGPVSGIGTGDLVAVGTFERITGVDAGSGDLGGLDISTIFLWENVAGVGALWPMWGGSPWRNGSYELSAYRSLPIVAEGSGLVPGSHVCTPSPLVSGPLQVRGSVRAPARVRAFVYNLEGEEVTRTDWLSVSAPDPFSLEIDLRKAVTGMYLSRLEIDTPGAGTESSVVQFTVVH